MHENSDSGTPVSEKARGSGVIFGHAQTPHSTSHFPWLWEFATNGGIFKGLQVPLGVPDVPDGIWAR